MRAREVSKLINSKFNSVIKGLDYLVPQYPRTFSPLLVKRYGKSRESFRGSFLCGPSCLLIKQILDKNGIANKVYKTGYMEYVDNEYVSDHVYIMLDSGEIVDPTLRQFLYHSTLDDIDSQYLKYISSKSPFYVGKPEELYEYLDKINIIYHQEFAKTLFKPESLINFWTYLPLNKTETYTLDTFKKDHNSIQNYSELIELFSII